MSAPAASNNSSTFVIIGLVVVGIIALAVFAGGGPTPLPRSATGMAGLSSWLKSNDISIRTYRGRSPLIIEETGLRILPLYDTDLSREKIRPETREEVIAQTTEVDFDRGVLRSKIEDIPTLVVLPKWQHGMRLLKVAHQDLLIPDAEMKRLLGQIGLGDAEMWRAGDGMTQINAAIDGQEIEAQALHAQSIAAENCTPIMSVGGAERMLFGRCSDGKSRTFHLLTDPDLISNHGLALAENGELALALANHFDTQRNVILDLTTRVYAISEEERRERYERKWTDFTRMFEWPFTMIWIAFAAVAGLVFWRAVTRYGPLARFGEDEPAAEKATSIAAKARLLRLANHDGELLRSHIRSRLGDLVAELIGPHRKAGAEPLAVLLPLVGRANADLARDLEEAAASTDRGTDVLKRLDRFEKIYDRVKDEFGRSSKPG